MGGVLTNCPTDHQLPRWAPPTPYTNLISKRPMTLETANLIWNACYASDDLSLWDLYTDRQRDEAIAVRSGSTDGQWGIWNISDRD
jgi:hypothetical protein